MPDPQIISAFLQQASAKGSKSTVLKPLGIMMAICISAVLSSIYFEAPDFLIYIFSGFCSLTMALYLGTYIYCLFTDKDALRSETYSIQKMALEKGMVGDDATGYIELDEQPEKRLIDDSQSAGVESKQ